MSTIRSQGTASTPHKAGWETRPVNFGYHSVPFIGFILRDARIKKTAVKLLQQSLYYRMMPTMA